MGAVEKMYKLMSIWTNNFYETKFPPPRILKIKTNMGLLDYFWNFYQWSLI